MLVCGRGGGGGGPFSCILYSMLQLVVALQLVCMGKFVFRKSAYTEIVVGSCKNLVRNMVLQFLTMNISCKMSMYTCVLSQLGYCVHIYIKTCKAISFLGNQESLAFGSSLVAHT